MDVCVHIPLSGNWAIEGWEEKRRRERERVGEEESTREG